MIYGHDTLFKALDGITSPVAGYRYPVGRWTRHLDPATLSPCEVGYHLAQGPGILPYLDTALYVTEACPEHGLVEVGGQLLTCQTRLVEVETWTARVARFFAADVAEAVLLAERACGREPDERLWDAVAAARRHADGLVGDDELVAAKYAAQSATVWAVARSAARAATRAAFWAASDAANAVTAWAAAAARDAAHDAAGGVSEDDARTAMFDRLALYLNGEPLPPVTPLYGPTAETSTR